MKKLFRKNQIIITTLAFLIAIAGYISYERTAQLKKETAPVSAPVKEDAGVSYDISMMEDTQQAAVSSTETKVAVIDDTEEVQNPGEAVLTSSTGENIRSAAEFKLNREQIRSKNREALNAVINNETLSEKQRKSAVDELVKLTEIAEKEADAELTLEAKGFKDVVVNMDDECCDVVLDMGEVTEARCAQVEDIVKRKTGVAADKIIISPIGAENTDSLEQ